MAQLWKERGNNMLMATSLCFQHSKHSTQNPFAIHSIPFGRTLDMNFSFSAVLLNHKEKRLSPPGLMQLSTWNLCFISAGHDPCDNFFGSLATPHSRSSVAWRQKSARPWIPTRIFPHLPPNLPNLAQFVPLSPQFEFKWCKSQRKRRRQWQKSVNDAKSATTMQKVVTLKSLLLHPLLLHQ